MNKESEMGEVKRYYEERDIVQLDILDYYVRHVSAMTSEGLYRKYAIAAELGYRDSVIDALRAENAELVALLEKVAHELQHIDYTNELVEPINMVLAKHRGEK